MIPGEKQLIEMVKERLHGVPFTNSLRMIDSADLAEVLTEVLVPVALSILSALSNTSGQLQNEIGTSVSDLAELRESTALAVERVAELVEQVNAEQQALAELRASQEALQRDIASQAQAFERFLKALVPFSHTEPAFSLRLASPTRTVTIKQEGVKPGMKVLHVVQGNTGGAYVSEAACAKENEVTVKMTASGLSGIVSVSVGEIKIKGVALGL